MSTGTDVVAAEAPAVPALAYQPDPITFRAEDIAFPRLYIGQFMSEAVKDGSAKAGDIYSATSKEDPDPDVLASATKGKGVESPGVIAYVLDMKMGKSITVDGELLTFDYDDPDAPDDCWATYNYHLAIPDGDTDLPYKITLTRTNQSTARSINTIIAKAQTKGKRAFDVAFELTTKERSNKKGTWYTMMARPTEAKPEHAETVASLAEMVAKMNKRDEAAPARREEPAI